MCEAKSQEKLKENLRETIAAIEEMFYSKIMKGEDVRCSMCNARIEDWCDGGAVVFNWDRDDLGIYCIWCIEKITGSRDVSFIAIG